MVKPPVTLDAPGPEVRVIDARPIVIAVVPANDGTLYQAAGVCWIRRGTNTIPMTTAEISEHLYATGALRWETQLCPNATLEHLDQGLIDRYLALRAERSRLNLRHSSREELLVGLHCAARDPQTDQMRPTNIGVLMFGFDPQFHIPQSEVVCVRYKDSLGVGRYVDRKIISGTPMELIDRIQDFLTTHMRVGAEIVGFKRVDLPEYPRSRWAGCWTTIQTRRWPSSSMPKGTERSPDCRSRQRVSRNCAASMG